MTQVSIAVLANLQSHEGLAQFSLLDSILMIIPVMHVLYNNNYFTHWPDGKYNYICK